MMIHFMSDKSGLKTRSLGPNAQQSSAWSQCVLVSSLFWKIVMGPLVKVLLESLETPGTEPTTPGLQRE